jgi:hypothetical protein
MEISKIPTLLLSVNLWSKEINGALDAWSVMWQNNSGISFESLSPTIDEGNYCSGSRLIFFVEFYQRTLEKTKIVFAKQYSINLFQ